MLEHVRALFIVPCVNWQAQSQIGLYRVGAFRLQADSANLVDQPDTSAFVIEDIEENAVIGVHDLGQASVKLRSAVAQKRSKHITGQADAMKAHQRYYARHRITCEMGKRDNLAVNIAIVTEDIELPRS